MFTELKSDIALHGMASHRIASHTRTDAPTRAQMRPHAHRRARTRAHARTRAYTRPSARTQGSTNKILNAYASVRFILIRCTPSQGPRTRNITKVYINSKYNILLTCFLLFFHLCPSNSKKHTPKKPETYKKKQSDFTF